MQRTFGQAPKDWKSAQPREASRQLPGAPWDTPSRRIVRTAVIVRFQAADKNCRFAWSPSLFLRQFYFVSEHASWSADPNVRRMIARSLAAFVGRVEHTVWLDEPEVGKPGEE